MAVAKKKTRKKATILTKAQRLARERAIITELRSGTSSYRQVAAKFSVSLPTVNAKARKAGIRRRPGARVALRTAAPTKARAQRAPAKARAQASRVVRASAQTRRAGRARQSGGMVRRVERFQEQFRSLVLSYYPNISLRKFEWLVRRIEKAIA